MKILVQPCKDQEVLCGFLALLRRVGSVTIPARELEGAAEGHSILLHFRRDQDVVTFSAVKE